MDNNTWDLSLIYKEDKEFYNDLDQARALLKVLCDQKGQMTKSSDIFLKFNEDEVLLKRLMEKMYTYAHLHTDVSPQNQNYQRLLSEILSFYEQVKEGLDFIETEIISNKDIVKSYLDLDEFQVYRYSIESVLREEDHLLSQEMETLLSKVGSISDTAENAFFSLRLEYDDVVIDGKPHALNSANLNEYLKNSDQSIRAQAYHNFYKEYKKYENLYATTLSGVMKKDAFYADVRKFKSPLEAALWEDRVPETLFYKILEKANKTHRPLFHRYNKLKKKLLKVDTLYNYDLFTPLTGKVTKNYTIDECFKIILEVTSVFGEEYTDIIKKARDERWIDFMPAKGKRMGAYSSGCYDTKPYILTNFIGDYNSLSTLIHELGHSCHTYLSCHYQEPVNSDYRIFVAEVASTVNETLLINYMLDKATDTKEKAYFLYEFLENCVGLIFRQPMYAEFEDILHQWAAKHEPMNASRITELYDKLNSEYYGEDVVNDPLVGHSCFYIPHYYYNYYVYKYTLGMTVALAIVSRILKGDTDQVENYLSFLKSGGCIPPVDLLKKAGVDPMDDGIYDDAFKYFESLLDEFEEIMVGENND